jgi:L-fuculose-phosphate aldolase
MSNAIEEMRAKIAYMSAIMFDRNLLDMAGGNISALVGDVVCITARYSGLRRQWQLKPEDVLVVNLDATILEGTGEVSREAKVHLRLHREFGEHGTAVIHAHSRNLMVFASLARPMPPVLEGTRKFGEIPVVQYAPAHSVELSENIAAAIRGQETRIRKQAAAAFAPYHGIFVMGKDLDSAADAVERLDTNAYCLLMAHSLGASPMMAQERAAMEDAIKAYEMQQTK